MKIGLTSIILPPSINGQSIVIYNLLKGIDKDEYILFSTTDYNDATPNNTIPKLDGTYVHWQRIALKIELMLISLYYRGIRQPLDLYLNILSKKLSQTFLREKCTVVVGCSADLIGTYVTYSAAREANIPFILYAFDDYTRQWTTEAQRFFAQQKGAELIANSDHLIVPNEFLCKLYNSEYAVNPVVIHNPVDCQRYSKTSSSSIRENSQIDIIFTGDIYEVHFNAFRDLIEAINSVGDYCIQLHLYTPRSTDWLERHGISGPRVVFHGVLSFNEVAKIQMNADILFLPLAPSPDFPVEILLTASPMKMGEYLASGRPILAYAPERSFVSWYLEKFECGIAVPVDKPDRLRETIVSITQKRERLDRMGRNAVERAGIDFAITHAQKRFLSLTHEIE